MIFNERFTVIIPKTFNLSSLPKDNTYMHTENPRLIFIKSMFLLYHNVSIQNKIISENILIFLGIAKGLKYALKEYVNV